MSYGEIMFFKRVNGKSQLTDVHCLLYVFRVLR